MGVCLHLTPHCTAPSPPHLWLQGLVVLVGHLLPPCHLAVVLWGRDGRHSKLHLQAPSGSRGCLPRETPPSSQPVRSPCWPGR